MRRPVFSFRPNMDNPEHRQAWEILQSVPEGQKNQFVGSYCPKSMRYAFRVLAFRRLRYLQCSRYSVTWSLSVFIGLFSLVFFPLWFFFCKLSNGFGKVNLGVRLSAMEQPLTFRRGRNVMKEWEKGK